MTDAVQKKNSPKKSLLRPLKKTGGRNNVGRITSRHRGGGAKRRYRLVSFGQKGERRGTVRAIEYDPNRTCRIALVEYEDGTAGYELAPRGLQEGMAVHCAERTSPDLGNRMKLKHIPVGTEVYNIEVHPGRGGALVRGAGTGARVLAVEGTYALLELPSKESRYVLGECYASIGTLSNPEHRFQRLRKAGSSRHRGTRPHVRGSAMNPVDHPHGGGEGRQSIGLKHPKTPWGKPALGVKTRRKKASDRLIIRRRKSKKK